LLCTFQNVSLFIAVNQFGKPHNLDTQSSTDIVGQAYMLNLLLYLLNGSLKNNPSINVLTCHRNTDIEEDVYHSAINTKSIASSVVNCIVFTGIIIMV